jgi:hypothetical protein
MKSREKIETKLELLEARRAEAWKAGRPSNPVNIREQQAERDRIGLETRIATLRWVLSPEWDEVF